jgi:hypothetical protein
MALNPLEHLKAGFYRHVLVGQDQAGNTEFGSVPYAPQPRR